MNIEKFQDAIKACRFCFMCRHLSGVGNVTCREADTPRIRAAFLDGVLRDKAWLSNSDFIDAIYSSDLSAACRFHCVNHFDENGLNLAARADIVEAGFAPAAVKALADSLVAKAKALKIKASGGVLYLVDFKSALVPSEAKAFGKIMKKAGVKYAEAEGGLVSKALKVLGFTAEAKEAAAALAKAINASKAEIVVTSNPAVYDELKNDMAEYGIKISAKVMHVAEYLCSLKQKFSKKVGKVFYLESDYLKNYNNAYEFPRELLKKLNAQLGFFGTNDEESYTCGEGAVVLDELKPEIVGKMAEYVKERADNGAVLAVAAPCTKAALSRVGLNALTLTELAAESL